ncbi:hypothetical protein [Bacteroides oleiciplenus]|uniref:Uncharacterized protein n=1 Tax=Bacteroides oleiciplenus TaxID=626931 RepID=A0A3E5B9N5_9BACE|nr:hypothetical protein [Bacteroides oleiciplenus]RGN34310.1 hypothetical protein DXB65_14595 [Bacteroides oleiciplenus]
MKTLKNFEAFKLNKVQMNAIAGGKICTVTIETEDGPMQIKAVVPNDMSNDDASAAIHDKYDIVYGGGNVCVTRCS